jgi:L-ascorbate metabolism protein UlaG (beta-lactamase superfamily)
VKLIQPKHVIPAHYNTWELIAQDPIAWKKRVESETDSEVHVLQPDSSLEF